MPRNRKEAAAKLQAHVAAGTFVPKPPVQNGNGFSSGAITAHTKIEVSAMRSEVKTRRDKARDPTPFWQLKRRKQDQTDAACDALDRLDSLPKL